MRRFFAAVVLNKLMLTLKSEKIGGDRIYRIVSGKPSKAKPRAGGRRPPCCLANVTGMTLHSSDRDEIDAEIDRIRSLDKPSADPKRLSSRPIKLPSSEGLSLDELRREWRRLYSGEPPRISRDLLMRGIGYRRQEIQLGGLGKATRRKLKTLAKMFRTMGRVRP